MATTRTKAILVGLGLLGAAAIRYTRRRRAAVPGGESFGTPETPPAAPDPEAVRREPRPPQPSNYDAAGPVANTATPIPAPDARSREAIDEEAEIAAAAAEAAAIGGGVPDYPGVSLSEHADEATRPLAEAGEGEAEGQELAEMELVEAAQPSDTMSDAQRQIEATIDAQANPHTGERPDPLPLSAEEPVPEAEQAARDAGAGRGPSLGGDPGSPPDDGGEPETWSGGAAGP